MSFMNVVLRAGYLTNRKCFHYGRMMSQATDALKINSDLHPADRLKSEDFFEVSSSVTLRDLYKSNVHLGHNGGLRHVNMTPYIFGSRLGIDIIDLNQTLTHLRLALNIAAQIASHNGIILFVSRNLQNMHLVEKAAQSCGQYAHCRPWQSRIFTDSTVLFGQDIRLPDLCIVLNCLDNVFEEHLAIRDSAKLLIPTIGIVDTNCDPSLITYPIPGNDDTPSAINLYCQLFVNAILRGKNFYHSNRTQITQSSDNLSDKGEDS